MRLHGQWILAVFAGLTILFPISAAALIKVGELDTGEFSESVAVEGEVAYLLERFFVRPRPPAPPVRLSILRAIDVSNPAAPVELGAIGTSIFSGDLVVADGLAYVAGFSTDDSNLGRLQVFDASNPAAPVELGAIDTPGFTSDVAVVGKLAYVVGAFGLRVINVSNPVAPVDIGGLETPGFAAGVAVADSFAYVADFDFGLRVIDVSNPAAPIEVGAIETFGRAGDVAVADGRAYLTESECGDCKLWVIDVSNPAAPVELGAIEFRSDNVIGVSSSRDLVVADGLVYIANGERGLQVVDVSDPSAPVKFGVLAISAGSASGVAVAGGLAYVASAGLDLIDVSNPAFPAELSTLEIVSAPPREDFHTAGIAVADGLAYITIRSTSSSVSAGLRIIDASNPSAPGELGRLEIPLVAFLPDVAVADGLAYIADGSSGLRIIDVSDPAAPIESGNFPGVAGSVAVATGPVNGAEGISSPQANDANPAVLAYVGDGGVLRIIDASNPSAPVEIGSLDTPGCICGVVVTGGLAYVAGGDSLQVIDVSNPAAPTEIGSLDTLDFTSDVAVERGLAYVADGRAGLRVIDVSNPAAPIEVGRATRNNSRGIPWRAYSVEVAGGFAYATDRTALASDDLQVIDASNPTAPVFVGANRTGFTDLIYGFALADGLVYIEARSGLRILDFGPEYAGALSVEIDIKPGSDSNSINPSLEGDLAVAILGSDSFEVETVNEATLAFGPGGASFDHSHGPHSEDLNGDGLTDLMSHFRIEETGIAFGDMMACLSGETLDGTPFTGCDSVRTVPDMDGDALLDVEEAAIGTNALNPDTDGDGYEDGQEVFVMGTDPLNARDPKPVRERRRGRKRSR
jgi:hypothetical protein